MVKTHPMWNNYPNIQPLLLECLELIIEKTAIEENKDIEKTVTDLIEQQGKLLRPAYFFLFSRLGNPLGMRINKSSLPRRLLRSFTSRPSFMTIS